MTIFFQFFSLTKHFWNNFEPVSKFCFAKNFGQNSKLFFEIFWKNCWNFFWKCFVKILNPFLKTFFKIHFLWNNFEDSLIFWIFLEKSNFWTKIVKVFLLKKYFFEKISKTFCFEKNLHTKKIDKFFRHIFWLKSFFCNFCNFFLKKMFFSKKCETFWQLFLKIIVEKYLKIFEIFSKHLFLMKVFWKFVENYWTNILKKNTFETFLKFLKKFLFE